MRRRPVRAIEGKRVLLSDGTVRDATVYFEAGRIAEIVAGRRDSSAAAMGDLLVLPGIVDIHGDAFERQLMPRPGACFPADIALLDTDHQMAANGITTAFHGLTVSWQPGPRDLAAANRFMEALGRVRRHLGCDTRVHLRHEILSVDTVEPVADWATEGRIDLLTFNDHSSFARRDLSSPEHLARAADLAEMPANQYRLLAGRTLDRQHEVARAVEQLASVATRLGIPLASHDDDSPETRRRYRRLNCRICEFPTNWETTDAAAAAGDAVVFGAPNVLRGASHCQRISVKDAIRLDLCSALSSDYYYPSMLHGAFRLASEGIVPLAAAWRLVSANPATAVGLADRGTLAPGQRGNLVVVDDRDMAIPQVLATIVGGVPVFVRDRSVLETRETIDEPGSASTNWCGRALRLVDGAGSPVSSIVTQCS